MKTKVSFAIVNAGERDVVPVFFDDMQSAVNWLKQGTQPVPYASNHLVKCWRALVYVYEESEPE